MLFRGEGIDLAAPICELAAGYFLIDLKRYIVYHTARFTADCFCILGQIFCTEGLDRE